jgi:Kef-type K+ transport system membrane component KefB
VSHADSVRFLVQVGVMLAVAVAFGALARRLRGPAVLGELLGGVVLGPTVLGALSPGLHAWLLPAGGPVAEGRETLVRLGLLGFVFTAGLDANLGQARRLGRSVLATSLLGIAVPFALGWAAVLGLPALWPTPAGVDVPRLALVVGTALSISALPVIARTLADLGLERTPVAAVALAAATIDDLIGWALFGSLLGRAGGEHTVVRTALGLALVLAVSTLALTAGRAVVAALRPWLRARLVSPPSWIGAAVAGSLLAAAGLEALRVHAVFGAFLAGLMLSRGLPEREPVHDVVHQVALGVLAPLYFVSVGLRIDLRAGFDWGLVALVLLIACLGKLVGAALGARLSGLASRDALAVAFAMNARGAMAMVLASVAFDHGLIEIRVFVALIVMSLVTSLIAGPAMMKVLGRRSGDAG